MGCWWSLPPQIEEKQAQIGAYYEPQRQRVQPVQMAQTEPLRVRRAVAGLEQQQQVHHALVQAPVETTVMLQQQQQQQQQYQLQVQEAYQPETTSVFTRICRYLMSAAPSAVIKTKEQREEEKFIVKEFKQQTRIGGMEDKITMQFNALMEMENARYEQQLKASESKEQKLQELRVRVHNRHDGRPTKTDELEAINLLTEKLDLDSSLTDTSKCKLAITRTFEEAKKYIHNRKKAIHRARINMAVKGVVTDDDQVEDELNQAEDANADMIGLNEICASFTTQTLQRDATVETKETQIADMMRALFARPLDGAAPSAPLMRQPVANSTAAINPQMLSTMHIAVNAAPKKAIVYGQQASPGEVPSSTPAADMAVIKQSSTSLVAPL